MTNAFRSSNCEKKKNHITFITINNNNILVTRPSKPNNYSIILYIQGVSEFVLP